MIDAAAIENKLRSALASASGAIAAAYLFGSLARGRSRPDSDVDVGILYRSPHRASYEEPLDLETDLECRLGRTVQVVVLDDAPVDLVHRVLRDGRLVLDRDRSRRIQFEIMVRNEFFDIEPILRRYRQARPIA